jgi:hypothetical protein
VLQSLSLSDGISNEIIEKQDPNEEISRKTLQKEMTYCYK